MKELATTDTRSAMLAMVERGELTTALEARLLREVEGKLDRAIASAELAAVLVRESGGPELHGLPAHLVTMTNMGTGYLRHTRDVIRALRRWRGKRRGR